MSFGDVVVAVGADVAAEDAGMAAGDTANSSAMLSRAATVATLSSFFFNLLSFLDLLHLPQVMTSGLSTMTPFSRAHFLHSLKFGQQINAKSSDLFLSLQVVHLTKPELVDVEDPPSEDTVERASAP